MLAHLFLDGHQVTVSGTPEELVAFLKALPAAAADVQIQRLESPSPSITITNVDSQVSSWPTGYQIQDPDILY